MSCLFIAKDPLKYISTDKNTLPTKPKRKPKNIYCYNPWWIISACTEISIRALVFFLNIIYNIDLILNVTHATDHNSQGIHSIMKGERDDRQTLAVVKYFAVISFTLACFHFSFSLRKHHHHYCGQLSIMVRAHVGLVIHQTINLKIFVKKKTSFYFTGFSTQKAKVEA